MFPTFMAFDETMQQLTGNREAMVIDQGCLSYNISDSVFFYKATPDLQYRLCLPQYWNEETEDDESDDSDEDGYNKSEENVKVKKKYPSGDQEPPRENRRSFQKKSGYGQYYKKARSLRR